MALKVEVHQASESLMATSLGQEYNPKVGLGVSLVKRSNFLAVVVESHICIDDGLRAENGESVAL